MNTTDTDKQDEILELARSAHLRYVSDTIPGIERIRRGNGFSYTDSQGKNIHDAALIERIENLHIPPAWILVWICPYSYGHIQATGFDEKGRKQYRYHDRWIEIANQNKFNNIIFFGDVLPEIRKRVRADLKISGLQKQRVLGTIVWLLEKTYVRIGNKEYAKENEHFGLTTLRNKHVEVEGSHVTLTFVGKSGKEHEVEVTHPRIARTIRRLEELPGYELFQYLDEEGNRKLIDSSDVNEYLKSITGEDVTAKDFRTWGGTVLSAVTLHHLGSFTTEIEAKKNLVMAVKEVASHLRNTPTVCKNYYIHPTIPSTYFEKILIPHFEKHTKNGVQKPEGLTREEYAVYDLLKKHPLSDSAKDS